MTIQMHLHSKHIGVVLVGFCLGTAAYWNLGVTLTVTSIAACVIALAGKVDFSTIFVRVLAILLCGYLFLGRGFAYLGSHPVFIGEVALCIAVVCILRPGLKFVSHLPLALPLALFVSWGAICTLPHVASYGVLALRDAVVWAYSAFAVAVAIVLGPRFLRHGPLALYSRVLPLFLLWVPVALLLVRFKENWIPLVPGGQVPLVGFLAGDAAVHLAGIFAFLVLRLDFTRPATRRSLSPWRTGRALLWGLWAPGSLLVATLNRGGMLAILTAVLTTVVLQGGMARWLRVSFFAVSASSLLLALSLEIDLGGPRKLSASQLATNLGSVIGVVENRSLSNTREWRIAWWSDIVDYTLNGEYFWTGKGFGVNLADADGYQVGGGAFPLRSPHNGHMTILARTGVPGFGLWVLLQGGFGLALLQGWREVRMRRDERTARIFVWVLAYWAAGLVNAGFSTALESPQAGIWFWSLFGYGLATIANQRAAPRSRTELVSLPPPAERPAFASSGVSRSHTLG